MILSCLQGHMGQVRTRGGHPPESALCAIGDFCFFAGRPDPALVRQADRYALCGAPEDFDRDRLAAFAAALPPGFSLSPILAGHYPLLTAQDWSRDLCGNFRDGPDFARRGLGVIALRDGVPAAGASSYAVWDGGIEIQIDTRPDLRRRGLALSCGARLILTCLDQGLLPSWDAHDRRSAALAEKLGYRLDRPYPAYLLDQTGP